MAVMLDAHVLFGTSRQRHTTSFNELIIEIVTHTEKVEDILGVISIFVKLEEDAEGSISEPGLCRGNKPFLVDGCCVLVVLILSERGNR